MDKAIRHTPGPWKAVTTDAFGSITIEAGGRSICDIIGTMPVDEGNARLIAAALDMAEALRAIESGSFPNASTLAINGDWKEAFHQLQLIARAALAKAGVE